MNNITYCGHSIRKFLGQNFLNDESIINNIISAINLKKNQVVVEIGPGLAALTEPISKLINHLIVIELDKDLAIRLKKNPSIKSRLTIYQQDAMTIDFDKISKRFGSKLLIFGNLPYNVSVKLIFYLFKYINVIDDTYFMVQKEVANRLVAKPNSKMYGRLSIMAQYYFQITKILEVLPDCFFPKPKVDSVLVRLKPHKKIPYIVNNLQLLDLITKKAFSHRRKILRNSLHDLLFFVNKIPLKIDLNMRAENISISQYCQIANLIYDLQNCLKNK